mgnify:FL=1
MNYGNCGFRRSFQFKKTKERSELLRRLKREWQYHVMILPAMILLFIFSYIPMFGLVIAFQKFNPIRGVWKSPFIGLDNFTYLLSLPSFVQVIGNTFRIACLKIIMDLLCPIILALLLNEVRRIKVKSFIQTVVYMPHFLSWVILSGILIDLLSPTNGVVNMILGKLGIQPIFFIGDADIFPYTVVISHEWKEMGFGAVIYLSALTSIDPTLYEAALVDGAGRWKQTVYITIPSLLPTAVLLLILSMGNVLNAGFDQVYNMYSISVYRTGDILDTFVYRLGLEDFQYAPAAAVGFFKSAVSCTLLIIGYRIAYKTTGYKLL